MNQRIPFDLPANFIWPAYHGRSVGNIPATVGAILQTPIHGLPPLDKDLWQPVAAGADRVVLLTLDAFGWNLLQAEREQIDPFLRRVDLIGQITSVFPSTTVSALSSMWTGAAPAQHGIMALNMFFPEYATEGQLLAFTPTFGRYPDALVAAGLDPEHFLQWPGLAEQFERQGVSTHTFKGLDIINSALSRMHDRGVTHRHGAITWSDMLTQLAGVLEQGASGPAYLAAYWPTIDSLSHYRSWDGAATRAELRTLLYQIENLLLNRLTTKARQNTLLFITGDHGQLDFANHIYLEDHPELMELLLMKPTGERRIRYLFAKQGRIEETMHYLNNRLGQALIALETEVALASGLFGPEPETAVVRERIGDIVVILRDDYVLRLRRRKAKTEPKVGGHGGMSAAEMQVPWLAIRLDGW